MFGLFSLSLAGFLVSGFAQAACPSDVSVLGSLTCSSNLQSVVDHTDESFLGGSCDDNECYTCGTPQVDEPQWAPEHVYSFRCQLAGTVRMLITDLPCDLDIYILNDTCDPNSGCLFGSTAAYNVDDEVTFDCLPGQDYFVVIEAYGAGEEHQSNASDPCLDTDGLMYSPNYTLSFDVSSSTGCAEDCDDAVDNDFDGDMDCDDSDCWNDAICCDLDGDGWFSEACLGADCDDADAAIHPGAEDLPGNGIDEDCSGTDAEPEDTGEETPEDTGEEEESPQDTGVDEGDTEKGKCGCASAPPMTLGWLGLVGLAAVFRRRR